MLISDSALVNKNAVMDGINSILTMFELTKQSAFPRNIMTSDYSGSFTVYDVGQLFEAFERSNFKDCRISAYPYTTDINQFIPNILLLDLDLDYKIVNSRSKQAANNTLRSKVNKLIARLQQIYKIHNFMILWTGNGRHVIVPFGFTRPFEHLNEFSKYLDLMPSDFSISEEFLKFAKIFLSDNHADVSNHPTFRSIFLRVPGTLNIKKKYSTIPEIVKIEHEWSLSDRDLLDYSDLYPSTDLLYEFMGHLDDKTLDYKIKQQHQFQNNFSRKSTDANATPWIETLWKTPVSDYRKRIIWLILTRYAINRRKMYLGDARDWIKQWLNRCNSIRSTGEITDDYIMYYLNLAKDSGYNPLAFNTLKDYDWKLVDSRSSLYNLIKNRISK